MKGMTVYGRRAMLAIEKQSTAVEGKINGNPNNQREVTHRFVNHTVTGGR